MAAQARAVYRGTITEIIPFPAESKPGMPPQVSLNITIRVGERIKGRTDSWMTLVRDTAESDTRYDTWMKNKTEVLWFVFSQDDPRPFPGSQVGPGLPLPPGQSWVAVHISPPDPKELAIDPNAGQGHFSMDFSVIKDGTGAIEATKRYLKANPDAVKVVPISVPAEVARAVGNGEGSQRIVVPVTPELETLALKMINSPEAFLPKGHPAGETAWIRASGVKALKNFQSDKNVAVLKPLLSDPEKGPFSATETPVKTYYWVRLAAYNVLTDWGVKPTKPVLQD